MSIVQQPLVLLHIALAILFLVSGKWDSVRPGGDGLTNLSNGAKESSDRQLLLPCQRSPVPEPCFYPETKHQGEVGHRLPNRIAVRLTEVRTSRQVSGTRDCAEGTVNCFYRLATIGPPN